MIALKRILVATDFGQAAETALRYGRQLARTFGAGLDVLYVCDNVLTRGIGMEGYVAAYPDLQDNLEGAARKQLDRLLSEDDRDQLSARPVIVTSNSTAHAIIDYAKRENIDLIVMGTNGRGAVAHLLMGSVAERVVRTAPCPVLTVRHPEHEFVRPDALVAVAKA